MPRYAKVILSFCLVLILILALALTLLATFNWNHARPWINRQATDLADRPVAIHGDLNVEWTRPHDEPGWRGWLPWPKISAGSIVVGSPLWAPHEQNMAQISQLSALINPAALLERTVQIASLQIGQADLLLHRQADGAANWTLHKEPQESASAWKVDLQTLSLEGVHAQVIDAVSTLDLKVELNTLQEQGAEDYGIGWNAEGTYHDAKIKGEGKTGGLLSLREDSEPFPVQGQVHIGSTTIALEGSVVRPQNLAALDVELKLSGDTMADLYPLLGLALPNTPPYRTKGHLIGKLEGDDTWRYESFQGVVGKSDLAGTLVYQVRKPRSVLTGAVQSKLLRLQDLGPLIGADTSDVKAKKKPADQASQPADKVLPAAAIGTDAWGTMDADVKFKGERILRDKDLPLDNIEAHVKLQNKVLSFTPLNFGIAGGTLSNTLTLNGQGPRIKAELDTAARNMKLQKLFPGAESMNASFGELHGDARITAQGRSVAELLAHSNGEIKALVSRGTISNYLLEAAGLNVANMVMLKLFGDEQIVLNCLASDFDVKDGLMTARAFRLETDDTIVDVSGTINLATEELDLDIRPANKTMRIFTLRSPLYAKGTFKNPDVGVQTGPLLLRAGSAIVLGVVATPFAALLPLLNVGADDATGCSSLVASANADPKAPPPGVSATNKTSNSRPDTGNRPADDDNRKNWPSMQSKP
ncbi:AsmA family protein [Pollutimonas harenae]|uniref:AsmA family protein n=1 Tax=Pollutimonas harenae TaxID=657015 RepID=A0A853GUX0_9BURK|nr:AsmA family protein [Pollutimonas harenae]NYT86978.1 AsmA family protein [Pollutimonas harenae]TEA69279.1 AsmA family protein [Pollutimonas harenae]